MPFTWKSLAAAAAVIAFSAPAAMQPAAAATPIDFGTNAPTAADDAAIRALLDAYTTAVSTGDEARFRSLLLNDRIPFTGVGPTIRTSADKPFDDAAFSGFDQSIFKSGVKYTQYFRNVHILQDGALAQVSLDFVTKDASGAGGWGWKILQLVKVDGAWKIASEFYTGHALPPGA